MSTTGTLNESIKEPVFHVPGQRSIIDSVRPDGRGLYSGETLEEIRKRYPDAVVAEWQTVYRDIEESARSAPIEITEHRWMYALEVLPPCRWTQGNGCSSFHVSELVVGNIGNIYVRLGKRYFEFADRVTLTHDQRVEAVLKSLTK